MNLVPWKRNRGDVINREHPVDLFRRQMDTLFDRFFGGLSEDFGQNRFWDFGITEGDKEFVVRAEMPSFEEKELDVRLENDMLTINAQKEHKGDGTQEFRRRRAHVRKHLLHASRELAGRTPKFRDLCQSRLVVDRI